jgi:hypothetical protein
MDSDTIALGCLMYIFQVHSAAGTRRGGLSRMINSHFVGQEKASRHQSEAK